MKLLFAFVLSMLLSSCASLAHVPHADMFPVGEQHFYMPGSNVWAGNVAANDANVVLTVDGRCRHMGNMIPSADFNIRCNNLYVKHSHPGKMPAPMRAMQIFNIGLGADVATTAVGIVACGAREANPAGAVLSVVQHHFVRKQLLYGDSWELPTYNVPAITGGLTHGAAALHNLPVCF